MKTHIEVASENSLIVYIGEQSFDAISEQSIQYIAQLTNVLQSELSEHIIDITPSYSSILVTFNIQITDHYHVRKQIRKSLSQITQLDSSAYNHVKLPVYYGLEVGIDLPQIAKTTGLNVEQIIEMHLSVEYRVWAIGFAPGFAYLGRLPAAIQLPRLATPRQVVKAGSVAIAEAQTAIYPNASPGGWNIIGNCPVSLFTDNERTPLVYQVGDKVSFYAINRDEFIDLGGTLP